MESLGVCHASLLYFDLLCSCLHRAGKSPKAKAKAKAKAKSKSKAKAKKAAEAAAAAESEGPAIS